MRANHEPRQSFLRREGLADAPACAAGGMRYRRFSRFGDTLESLTAAMRRKLLDAIPTALRKAGIKEPVYGLAIVYDSAADEHPSADRHA